MAVSPDRDDAFTLVELLVVVLIIGILAAIAIPLFARQQTRSQEAVALATLRSAATYMEVALTEDEAYPTTIAPLVAQGFRAGRITVADIDVTVSGDDFAIRGFHTDQPAVVACLRSAIGSPLIIDPADLCEP